MSFDEIEELIRKYLSTGIAVVVILVAPGTGQSNALPDRPEVVTIEPGPSGGRSPSICDIGSGDGGTTAKHLPGTGSTTGNDPGTSGSDSPPADRTGAGGTDPGSESSDNSTDAGSTDTNCEAGPATGSNDDKTGNRAGDDSAGTGDTSGNASADSSGDTSGSDSGNGSGSGSGSGSDTGSDNSSGSDNGSGSGSDSGGSGPAGGPGPDNGSDNSGTDAGSDKSGSNTGSDSSGTDSPQSAGTGTSAAEMHGWGKPNREDDFSGGADQWSIYDGPGHAGKGTRSPSAVSLNDGILTITGDSSGTTAGMAWNPGQKYGRWEGRVKAPASDPSYNALLLLWPDAEDFPVGGEIDFMEMMDHTRQKTDLFLHYGADNSQVNGSVEIDATQWHNWAVEWTPDAITAFVDGKEWFRTTDKSIFPPGPMHMTIQLDWFPKGDNPKESTMMVDWVRQYSLDGGSGNNDSGNNNSGGDSGANSGGSSGGDNSDSGSTSDKRSGPDGSNAPASSTGNKDDKGDAPILDAIRRMFSWR